jgi:hypothetical protein
MGVLLRAVSPWRKGALRVLAERNAAEDLRAG